MTTETKRSRTVLIAALVAACLAFQLSCAHSPDKTNITGPDLFGMHLLAPAVRPYEAQFASMEELGVKWVRADARWFTLEPEQGKFDWAELDGIVTGVSGRGFKLMVTIRALSPWGMRDVPPNYSKPGYHADSPPKDMAQYRSFVGALVSRYRGKGIAWQIGNEQNAKMFWSGTLEEYVSLLKAGYQAVHEADPQASVLPAGLACGFSRLGYASIKLERIGEWFNAILDSKAFDALDVHDYYPPEEGNPWGLSFEKYLLKHKEWMRSKGIDVPLWMSEAGVSSEPVKLGGESISFTPDGQADELQRIYDIASRDGVEHVFWLKIWDTPETVLFSNTGLATRSGGKKPAWEAYRRLASGGRKQ